MDAPMLMMILAFTMLLVHVQAFCTTCGSLGRLRALPVLQVVRRSDRFHREARGILRASAADARSRRVLDGSPAIGEYICKRVQAIAAEAIAAKGSFAMSIGSGTTVKPLVGLASSGIDFNKVHVLFGNERVMGDTAYKCYSTAEFVSTCKIPLAQVYKVPSGKGEQGAAAAAVAYEDLIKSLSPDVLGVNDRTGLPALDLVLLGSGADGHCASLYPDSPQVLLSPSQRCVVEAAGKGGTTFTLDLINSARHVIISAPKPDQKDMVYEAFTDASPSTNTRCPAGMITAGPGTQVEWLLSSASASRLPGGL